MKDRKQGDISSYSEFEEMAIPRQLRQMFREKAQDKDTLVVDDNLNTGQSLYNIRRALEEIAKSVDISTAEVVPLLRVIDILRRDFPKLNPHNEVKLVESNLTYTPIGWWRDQIMLYEKKVMEKIIGLR